MTLIQASGSMSDMYAKSEQHQNDFTVNMSCYNHTVQSDSHIGASHDQLLKCEQWDIKPDPYLQLEQDLKPDLNLKSELSTLIINPLSQQDQQYHEDISIISAKESNGL